MRLNKLIRNQFDLLGETIRWFFIFDIVLGLTHILWPNLEWGDDRSSYFYFGNQMTLASWYSSMKLLLIGLLLFFIDWKVKAENLKTKYGHRYTWIFGGVISVVLSILEMTRIHQKLDIFVGPQEVIFQSISLGVMLVLILGFFFFFSKNALQDSVKRSWVLNMWLVLWLSTVVIRFSNSYISESYHFASWLIAGLGFLVGGSFLLLFLGYYILEYPEKTTSIKENS